MSFALGASPDGASPLQQMSGSGAALATTRQRRTRGFTSGVGSRFQAEGGTMKKLGRT
jgi:hypothetical protein